MRFRAILMTEEELPRAVQSFSDHIEAMDEWARIILKKRKKKWPKDYVRIWRTAEMLEKNVYPLKDKEEEKDQS